MAKIRVISLFFVLALAFSMLPIQTFAANYNEFLEFEDVKDPLPKPNYLSGGDLNSNNCVKQWKSNSQKLEHVTTESGGGYLRMSNIALPYVGFDFKPSSTIGPGKYKMTAYFRTAYEGELTELRFVIYDAKNGTNTSGVYTAYVYPTSDEWLKVEFYIEFENNFTGFKTAGGPRAEMIQAYCVDNISMEKVNEFPEGYVRPTTFGTPITKEQAVESNNGSMPSYPDWNPELDFQREIWLWHTGGEYNGLDLLNDFMRKLDGVIATYEEKYGHEIKVAARVASDIQTNYDFGLDVITWASEDLMDMVILTGRFATTDFDVPVRSWAAVMHPFGVEVAPGVEAQINTGANSVIGHHDLDTFAGLAASWYSQGADKFYVYNHYLTLNSMMREEFHKSSPEIKSIGGGSIGYWNIITTVGSYDKLMNYDRRIIMTYNDIAANWKGVNYTLPYRVAIGETGALRVPVGDIPEGATVTLKLGVNAMTLRKPPEVRINLIPTEAAYEEYSDLGYTENKMLCYLVPAEACDDMYIVIEITPEMYFAVDYVEVYIEPVR